MKLFIKSALITALAMSAANLEAQISMIGTVVNPCNNNGVITVTVAGLTPPITYVYYGPNNQMFTNPSVNSTTNSLSGIGAYQSQWGNPNTWYVQATSGVNTVGQSFTITPPFTDSLMITPAICPAQGTVAAVNFQGGTAPYSCVWTHNITNVTYTGNPVAVPMGQYNLVITDAGGCQVSTLSGTTGINVMSISNISLTMSGSAASCTNGVASVVASGGTAPYSYLWSNNAVSSSINGLTQGYYTVIVTDAQGCQKQSGFNVTQSPNINFNSTITQATCLQSNGGLLGFVTGGTAPYTFQWSNGATTQNLTGVPGGTSYIVQITDANNCTGTGFAYIGKSTPITVTYTATASSCTASTGSATITAIGGQAPYSVVWYNFPTNTTGTSIANKTSGTYAFQVTDANGCVQQGSAFIPFSSVISGNVNNSTVLCPANTGTLSMSVQGSSPPFTYLWSNSATTSQINNVPLGSYNCTVTDAAGCKIIKNGYINQTSAMTVAFSSTAATCLYSNNGAITANATGGTSPYTYLWSNNQTGPTLLNVGMGMYYVTATDANGCKNSYLNSGGYVNNSGTSNACYCTITGTVYNDANTNCAQNTGEMGLPGVQIYCSGFGYAYTNSNGVYSFQVPTGTYTITQSVPNLHPLATCQSNNQVVNVVAAANCVSNVNFANTTVLAHDLHIITSYNWAPPIPGNAFNHYVIVQNEGTYVENTIKLGYQHDGQLTYSGSAPWAMTQQNSTSYPNWYSINTGFPTLNLNSNSSNIFSYNVPTNIPLGTTINIKDTVAHMAPINTAWLTDYTPWNNVTHFSPVVVGSWDPNFKEVSPAGTGTQGVISNTVSELTYVIHFQNEGSYFAQNVVLIDSLDSDLQITSVRPGFSDHKYTTTINNNGVIKFSFNNINLKWKSQYGDALSSGMIVYTVKLKNNLPVGTQIKNKAAIYFDYNEPVITNTTLNTIGMPVGINDYRHIKADNTVLYPNPAKNYFNLFVTSGEDLSAVLNIYDVSGREISSQNVELHTGENTLSENTERLQNGIYFVQLKSGNTLVQKKLVIAK